MRTMNIKAGSGQSEICIGESAANIKNYCGGKKAIIIADRNAISAHRQRLKGLDAFHIIEIDGSEEAKTLKTVEGIYLEFLKSHIDRSSLVIGMGGGVVTDITGFAASTFKRGIQFGLVPTTLLGQADASIGGKNGVNLLGYKNIVGTIRQPKFVICDFEFLETLPEREIRCGFAEIIKHGAIADGKLFMFIEENQKKAMSLHKSVLEKILNDSIAVKAKIVETDETEKGERAKLNFGHTIGHAIENANKIPHGEAVSIGMAVEGKIAVNMGLLKEEDLERLVALLNAFGLQTKTSMDKEKVLDSIRVDKKIAGDSIKLPVLTRIGSCKIEQIKMDELEGALNDLR